MDAQSLLDKIDKSKDKCLDLHDLLNIRPGVSYPYVTEEEGQSLSDVINSLIKAGKVRLAIRRSPVPHEFPKREEARWVIERV